MQLRYIADCSSDCPLIRLYDFGASEAKRLHGVFREMAENKKGKVALQDLPFVESVNGCRLTLIAGDVDQGIQESRILDFKCVLTSGKWEWVAYLTEPFMNDISGYQWLDETGPIELLLSSDGGW